MDTTPRRLWAPFWRATGTAALELGLFEAETAAEALSALLAQDERECLAADAARAAELARILEEEDDLDEEEGLDEINELRPSPRLDPAAIEMRPHSGLSEEERAGLSSLQAEIDRLSAASAARRDRCHRLGSDPDYGIAGTESGGYLDD